MTLVSDCIQDDSKLCIKIFFNCFQVVRKLYVYDKSYLTNEAFPLWLNFTCYQRLFIGRFYYPMTSFFCTYPETVEYAFLFDPVYVGKIYLNNSGLPCISSMRKFIRKIIKLLQWGPFEFMRTLIKVKP